MPRFAHMSDVHIGAFRQEKLREALMQAFDNAIDRCVEAKVDFVIMAGDIFDSNIPDLSSVKRAAAKIRQAKESGMRFYVVYGSHDFSPNYASIVDVLEGAGLFIRADRPFAHDGKTRLEFVRDPSGVALCGISGKRIGLDIRDYESLDMSGAEREPGLKIFVFHGAIEELKPEGLKEMKAIPAAHLPEGFDYYAGGHVHHRSLDSLPGRPNIAFPGPLFGGEFRDLEYAVKGGKRGLYIVDFDTAIRRVDFVPTMTTEIAGLEYSAQGKSSEDALRELRSLASGSDVEGKIVLIRVSGELSRGKTSDIDFGGIRKELESKGALFTLLNHAHLTSTEQEIPAGPPKPPDTTERELFEANITSLSLPEPALSGKSGVDLSLRLLKTLREEQRENEEQGPYQSRIERSGLKELGLEEMHE